MTSRKTAVITLAIGDHFEEMGKITHPLMRAYAEKCNSDFIVISEPKLQDQIGLVTYEKFQLYDYLDGQYDQVLFIDTDIVVSPDSPNLFLKFDPKTFAASNEETYSMAQKHKKITQKQLGKISWKYPYFNSGVMLISPYHRHIFDPTGETLTKWINNRDNDDHVMSDQPILNYMINASVDDFYDLGYKFNRTRVLRDTHNRFDSYFIHYAGPSGHRYGERLKQLEKDVLVMNSKSNRQLSKYVPAYRYIADRLDIDFAKYVLEKVNTK